MGKRGYKEDVFICSKCKSLGYYRKKEGSNKYIVCNKCGQEMTVLNCLKCGCEFELSIGKTENKTNWECPACKNVNYLDSDLFNTPAYIRYEKKQKAEKVSKINIWSMLWERKFYYLAVFIIVFMIELESLNFGNKLDLSSIAIPSLLSFIFGYMIHMWIKEPDRAKKEGRYIIYTKEGLIHLVLGIGLIFVIGIIYNIFKVILH